jgi:hypothetical protein
VPVRRNQHHGPLANRLFGRIAVEPLCACVPTCDNAIKVDGKDCGDEIAYYLASIVESSDDGGRVPMLQEHAQGRVVATWFR